MLRSVLLAAASSKRVHRFVESTPLTARVVRRFVAGVNQEDVLGAARRLGADGLFASIDYLGEDLRDSGSAENTKNVYTSLLAAIAEAGLATTAEVSVKLSALGLDLDAAQARDHAAEICAAASSAYTTVTIDAENAESIESSLQVVEEIRKDFPNTGAVVQAYLNRAEGDCRALSYAGSRVRLCKGAYAAQREISYTRSHDVDKSFVRCLNVLLAGDGYPMVATHDPRLVAITSERIEHYDRALDSLEFQMLYGVRSSEARRLSSHGYTVRIYTPYGDQWYPYLMRRLAERPANIGFFLRALVRGHE